MTETSPIRVFACEVRPDGSWPSAKGASAISKKAAPLGVTQPVGATQLVFVKIPNNWDGVMHPPTKRQLMVVLSGRDEIIASNGTSHTFEPGDTLFMEDTAGKGPISRCTDDTTVLMVHLA